MTVTTFIIASSLALYISQSERSFPFQIPFKRAHCEAKSEGKKKKERKDREKEEVYNVGEDKSSS